MEEAVVTDRTVFLKKHDDVVDGAKPRVTNIAKNLPRKRKENPCEAPDLEDCRKGTPVVGKKRKPESLKSLKNIKKLNVITNHFQPISKVESVGDGGSVGRKSSA